MACDCQVLHKHGFPARHWASATTPVTSPGMRTSTLLVLAFAAACNKSEPAPASAPAQTAEPAQAPAAAAEKPAAAAAGSAKAGGLTFSAPKPFVSRTPKSSMRAAEYGLDGAPTAELAVFYFGAAQGGGVEANMTRWVGQLKQADGSETVAKRSERTAHDIPISVVEASGNYGGGMAPPGAPPPAAIDDALMLGAIAKGPEGSVFFKLVGPRSAVEAARGAFDQMLESVQKAP